jgi:phage terminase Nu1 subunit (DNA packaging protein)
LARSKASSSDAKPDAKEAAQGHPVDVIARILGITPRRVQQLAKEGLPTAGRGRYPLVPCVQWYVKYWQDRAEGRVVEGVGGRFDLARTRKVEAEAQLAEIEVAEAEGRLVPLEVHERRVIALCDRLRAVLMTVPSKYMGRISVARTDGEARLVGEAIRDETLASLVELADEIEADAGRDDRSAPDAAA